MEVRCNDAGRGLLRELSRTLTPPFVYAQDLQSIAFKTRLNPIAAAKQTRVLSLSNGRWGFCDNLILFKNLVLMCVLGPARQGPGFPGIRIQTVPVGSLGLLGFHHPVPPPHKVGALIIEAHPLKGRRPCGELRCSPPFHLLVTMGTFGNSLIIHCLTPYTCETGFIMPTPCPLKKRTKPRLI